MSGRLPTPQVQAFVVCGEITQDDRTGEIVITNPVSRWRAVLSGHEPVPPRDWQASKRMRQDGFSHTKER